MTLRKSARPVTRETGNMTDIITGAVDREVEENPTRSIPWILLLIQTLPGRVATKFAIVRSTERAHS